jgi:hypothetical protein
MRRLHRISGLVAVLFLFTLSVTGILLNHPNILDTQYAATSDKIPYRLSAHASHPKTPHIHFSGTEKGLYVSHDNAQHFTKVPLRYPAFKVSSIHYVEGSSTHLIVGFKNHLVLESLDSGETWERLDLDLQFEYILSAKRLSNGDLYILSDSGVYIQSEGYWTQTLTSNTQSDWMYLVRKIHSGYIFAPFLIWAHDLAAFLFIGLGISGLILYFKNKRK